MQNKIPEEDYKKILETVPIPCVDLIIYHEGKVLLVYRKNEPAKGMWWMPGGRVFKNESLKDAAIRKAKEEVGIDVNIKRKIGFYETMFDESNLEGVKGGTHTINSCFVAEPVEGFEVKIDLTSLDSKWIDKKDESLHPYIKEVIKDSKVFD